MDSSELSPITLTSPGSPVLGSPLRGVASRLRSRLNPTRWGRWPSIGLAVALVATVGAVALGLSHRGNHGTLPGQLVDWATEPTDSQLAARAPSDNARHAEQFYFVLPDRFANGNPANDRGGLTGDRMTTGYDPTDKGFYHGGDLQGLINKLDYIKGLGTTAIWLAPVFKNKPVQGSGANASAGYHGYWITDFTQVDPHFGTNEDLKRLVERAHEMGMKIYLDAIVNHTADVIQYAGGDYSYRNKTDAPYKDANGNPFNDSNYADGTHGFPKVNLSSFPYTPVFANPADATAKSPAWLNDPTMYHNRGNTSFNGENAEYGDFFGLDDLWTERPDVVSGMTKIYQQWIDKVGVDGFRIDTVKNVDMAFWPQFTSGITRFAAEHDKPNFFMFGEVYSSIPEITSQYVRQGGLPATLDFPFQDAATAYVAQGASAQRLSGVYASDDLYSTRDTSAEQLPLFLGNHDMGRVGMFIRNGVATSAADQLNRAVLAEQLMFLTRGQPIIYSGDEQGFTGAGGDKDARQDMFASQVPDYLSQPLIGTTRTHAVDNYDTNHPIYRAIADLSALRAANPALRDSIQVTRYAADGPGIFAVTRTDRTTGQEYVVAFNNDTTAHTASVPTSSANTAYAQIYPAAGPSVTTGADTAAQVTVPALSAVVLKAASPIPAPAAAPAIAISSPAANTGVASRAEVVADVTPATGPASVTFAVKLGDAGWKLLGTADHAPYRVYHDLTGLPANTPLIYKAVVKDAAGHLVSTKTTAFVATPPVGVSRDRLLVHYQRTDGNYTPWGLYTWGDIDPSQSTPWPTGQPFAGEDSFGRFAWVKVLPKAHNVGFLVVDSNGTKDVTADRSADPNSTGEIWLRSGDPTVYTSEAAANGHVTVHYGRPDGQYTGWGLHLWGDGLAPGAGTSWGSPRPFDGVDSFGAYWNVPTGDPTKAVNFIIHNGNAKDPGPDQSVIPATNGNVWIRSGEAVVHPTRAAAEHTAVLHYRRADGTYAGWGLHVWTGAATATDWGNPLPPVGVDAYGAVFRVPLADGATSLSYIVHKGDTKDLPADQSLDFAANGHEVWLLAGEPRYLLPQPKTAAPDTDLTKSMAQWLDRSTLAWKAGPTDGRAYDLLYSANGGLAITDGHVTGPASDLRLIANPDGLTEAQRAQTPHLWQYPTFTIDPRDLAKVPDALRGQVIAVERDDQGKVLSASSVQIPGVLDDVYHAATTAKLGPTFDDGVPTLAVWAPTAHQVDLELYDTPSATPTTVAPMAREDATGVWRATGPASWKGKYYRFRVSVWQPATQQVVTASVTDPYSVALAANSTHSQIVDLSDPATAPAGWSALVKPKAVAPGKIQIQELSVRDFSIGDTSVPAGDRGTYLAFADTAGAGMRHLADLANAGLTHIHLMPVFDFSSTPERRADQATPACDLATLPPDSTQQQTCVGAVAATDGYNWGYDPWHFTTPEGSYATDPDGVARTVQFRQMVQGLNHAGLRVVMDVVYNHTTAAGTDPHSVLDQVVPGYYHRLLDDGRVATSTCCANTAPEHAMMGKLVVDSIVTWARQYKVDGFRFDLMGHHPKANILAVRAALDALTLEHDGVDGKNIYIYGEGWNFGEVANNARFVQATQANLAGTGIGTFNDRLRDAVRGGGPFDGNPHLQGFASGLYTDPNGDPINGSAADQRARLLHEQDLIKVGLAGNLAGYRFTDSSGHVVTGSQVDYNGSPAGYTGSPSEAITYVDAHDNEILYDALAYKLPAGTSDQDRARMQVLALSTTLLGQGVGFAAGGSDVLRSKSLDKNSYNSGDWFNQMSWDCTAGNGFGHGLPMAGDNQSRWPFAQPLLASAALIPSCAAVSLATLRYQELLRIRQSSPLFGLSNAGQVQRALSFPLSGSAETPGVITMRLSDAGLDLDPDSPWHSIVVVFNATASAQTQTVAGLAGTSMALHPVLRNSADPAMSQASYDIGTGTFTVPARTVVVFVQS
jgi:pullulanase-type alpha-1,6-glucosidase